MDRANRENKKQPLTEIGNCYKVASLTDTILDAGKVCSLKDRYVLGDGLGWGQFGVIRICSDKLTGETFACKSISKNRLVTVEDVRSVKLEIEIMTKLSGHPNVVDLKAVFEEEDYVHLVMELCAGGELFHQLQEYGRFPESRARVLFRHLMQVVKFCHSNGIVHRDLKPENILLATPAVSSPIKLADFGLATYIESGQRLHGTVGSPFYIAPEVLSGGYNEAADVWSAGVILYILLGGVPPFWGKTKSKIFEAVRAADLRFPHDPWDCISISAKDLISSMLCIDPAKRITVDEVLAHSWMDISGAAQELFNHNISNYGEPDGYSSLILHAARDQDYSFSNGELGQSPFIPSQSSFTSFIVDDSNPITIFGGFPSVGPVDIISVEVPPEIQSIPSFSFFAQSSDVEQGSPKATDKKLEGVDSTPRELHFCPDSMVHFRSNATEEAELDLESRKGGSVARLLGVHSRRYRSIGLGELDKLSVAVNESVIRWASCTCVPTPPSLRLSLVC